MNIKYRFDTEKISQPLTPVSLFNTTEKPQWDPTLQQWTKPVGGLFDMSNDKPRNVFEQNINLINQRISQITKQLTYWDLYKLVAQVTSPADLNSIFAKLIPGQACVINCNSFTDNNQDYHRGDVIVKMLDGEAAYIPAVATGLYIPKRLTKIARSKDTTDDSEYYFIYIPNLSNEIHFYTRDGVELAKKENYIATYPELLDNFETEDDEIYILKEDIVFNSNYDNYDIDPNYTLIFEYNTSEPAENEKIKSFILNPNSSEKSFIYGIYEQKPETGFGNFYVFKNYTYGEDGRNVQPIIKFYTANHEEVDVHVKAILNESTQEWSVVTSGLPSCVEWIQIK